MKYKVFLTENTSTPFDALDNVKKYDPKAMELIETIFENKIHSYKDLFTSKKYRETINETTQIYFNKGNTILERSKFREIVEFNTYTELVEFIEAKYKEIFKEEPQAGFDVQIKDEEQFKVLEYASCVCPLLNKPISSVTIFVVAVGI